MQSAQVPPSQVRRESGRRLGSRSSPRTFEPTHFFVGRIRASGWFASRASVMPGSSRRCVLTAGRQPHCHGRACPGGGDEGETIRRACKNPVNPILLGTSPLALQVRMGQVRMGQVRMMRRAAFDPPSRQSCGRRIRGSKSADQGFIFPCRRRCNTRLG